MALWSWRMYLGIRIKGCAYPVSFHRSFSLMTGDPGVTSSVVRGLASSSGLGVSAAGGGVSWHKPDVEENTKSNISDLMPDLLGVKRCTRGAVRAERDIFRFGNKLHDALGNIGKREENVEMNLDVAGQKARSTSIGRGFWFPICLVAFFRLASRLALTPSL